MRKRHPTPYALILDEKRRQPEKNKMDTALKGILAKDMVFRRRTRYAGERRLLTNDIGDWRKGGKR